MNLAIDIGNSHIKAAVFESGQLVETFKTRKAEADIAFIDNIFTAYPAIDRAIAVASGNIGTNIADTVRGRVAKYMEFDHTVPVPLANRYRTPQTLGYDRLAAAVGANSVYPECNVLVVDFGTAITFDMVTATGEFLGGNISPGLELRLRSLHEHTDKLPMCEPAEQTELIASDTDMAITSGVQNGILYEIEGYIARLDMEYDNLKIVFTGGDGKYFAKRLKNTIFVTYDLVVYGLNRILEYNAGI